MKMKKMKKMERRNRQGGKKRANVRGEGRRKGDPGSTT